MNSKEALEELKNNFGLGVIGRSLCEIIEQDLESLNKLEKEYDTIKYCYEKLTKDHNSLKLDFNELFETNNIFYNTKEKYKKAIELLKKCVGFKLVIDPVDSVRGITIKYEYSDISKQEYELLKEVLNYE